MSRIIGKSSALIGKDELNLFGLPPTQVAAERCRWLSIYPKNSVPETDIATPIIFEISGVPDFLDLHKNILKTKFQIKRRNGDNIDGTDEVAPINYISNTFIKQMKIFLNNRLTYDSQDNYMHRCYMEILLNATKDVKNTQLQLAGWYQDDWGENGITADSADNPGYRKRKTFSNNSAIFEVLAPLHSDIFNQNQYMLPNVNMRIELFRNTADQTLMAFSPAQEPPQYNLHIKSIELNVRVVEIAKSLSMTIERHLTKQLANYPIKRTAVRVLQLTRGTSDVHNLEVYNGQLPTTMLVTFLASEAYNGALRYCPFQFYHYGLQHIQALVGGRRWPLEKPLEMDISENEITEAYYQFVNSCGFGGSLRESNGVTMDDYKKHSFFIAFDLRNDEKDDAAVDLIKHGETRIFLKFKVALPSNIHMVVYMNFDNILRIDLGRNPILDYSV